MRLFSFIRGLSLAAATASALGACTRAPAPPSAPSAIERADGRAGLRAGLANAGEAQWNMRVLSKTQSAGQFAGAVNSDLAFTGKYAIQGSFNGFQVYDLSNPSAPTLVKSYYCPASQSDVSVYKHLLFVSGEDNSARLDCGDQGVREPVSTERLRGIRIFDITDIANPKYVANVQTCRGSHTHTVLEDPTDKENVYIYVSGSSPIRSAQELPGCVDADPAQNPNSSRFRIEVIQVPLANPQAAKIVSSPRIFNDLAAPPSHGASPIDAAANRAMRGRARAAGTFTADVMGDVVVLPPNFVRPLLDSVVKARGGTGAATSADSAALRGAIPAIIAKLIGSEGHSGPTQCHDITVYPAVGLAGGACEGYGLLLDIRDPTNPKRIGAVADSNFSYWHSATFNNDGTKVLFSDEWGGGSQPKCRAGDPKSWGADAIFTLDGGQMNFQSYYKLPSAQTAQENCVAHNGSLIPIPGRDVMIQSWYQGGVSVFDWTDAKRPTEIAYFDRGPVDSSRMVMGGSWSVYWYNGVMVSSEIARGLDVMELTPSEFISQNELDAAKTVHYEYLNAQGQPKMVWPPSFALARAYVDQLERAKCLPAARIGAVRSALAGAERAAATPRREALQGVAAGLDADAPGSCDRAKVQKLAQAVRDLAAPTP